MHKWFIMLLKSKEWNSNLLASACVGAAIPSSSAASEATENGRKKRRMEESNGEWKNVYIHRCIFRPPKCSHLTFTRHKGHSKFKLLRAHASEPTQNQLCIYRFKTLYIYIYIYMFKYLVEKLTTYWNTENDTPISWPQPLLAMVQQFRHHPGPPKQRRMEESRHRFIFWPPKCSHLTFTIHKGHSKFKPLRNNASIPTQNKYVYIYIHDSTCMYKYIDMHIH